MTNRSHGAWNSVEKTMIKHLISHAGCACLLALVAGPLWAGPPLTFDDTDVLEPGQWELIIATSAERRRSGSSYELPVLDLTYGISENVEMFGVLPRISNRPRGEPGKSDFGLAEIGVKWRFIASEALAMAIAPTYEFPARSGATDRDVVDDERALLLPLLAEYAWQVWRVAGQLGYIVNRGEPDGLSYAAALARPLSTGSEIMFMLYGESADGFDERSLAWRLGLDMELAADFNLLLGVGTGLRDPDGDDLRLDLFLGLQWAW